MAVQSHAKTQAFLFDRLRTIVINISHRLAKSSMQTLERRFTHLMAFFFIVNPCGSPALVQGLNWPKLSQSFSRCVGGGVKLISLNPSGHQNTDPTVQFSPSQCFLGMSPSDSDLLELIHDLILQREVPVYNIVRE
jgi:hypothetical protein